jgi:hypothetical protein
MSWCRTLKVFLQNKVADMTIEYKHWVVTDRTTLTSVTQQSEKFNENLVSKIPELTSHHCTAKQARYLKQSKENLQSDRYIILAYLSENYSLILQDAIHGFTGQKSGNSSSFCCLYQRSTPANLVLCD